MSGMFIHADVKSVTRCLIRWANGDPVNRGLTAECRRIPLAEAWDWVATRKFNPTKAFLVGTTGGWTGFFDNHSREFLAQSELYVLCEFLATETCFFSFDDRSPGQEGSAAFNHNRHCDGPIPVDERQVMTYRESRWVFSAHGEPRPFENVHAYGRKRKCDRLTIETLQTYGDALGIRFWDPAFYSDEVVLLEWGEVSPGKPEKTMRLLPRIFGRVPRTWFGVRDV